MCVLERIEMAFFVGDGDYVSFGSFGVFIWCFPFSIFGAGARVSVGTKLDLLMNIFNEDPFK